jgi:hypothetical protein
MLDGLECFGMYGWGNVDSLSSYEVGTRDVYKRDKVDNLDTVSTAYHDRLRQFDDDKYVKACKKACVSLSLFDSTEDQIDAFLTAYFGYPCRMFFVEVQRGMNGYDYVRMDYQYSSTQVRKK